MMELFSFLSALASVIYLTVGINTYGQNRRSRIGSVFLLLTISLSFWSFTYALAYVARNAYYFSLWNKLSAFGWCFFPALVLYLVLIITDNKYCDNRKVKAMLFLPAVVFLLLTTLFFWPDKETNVYISVIFYYGDFLYNLIYTISGLSILYVWGRKSKNNIQRKQSQSIVTTSCITFLLYLVIEYILPAAGVLNMPNISQIVCLIMLWGIYYAIIRYNFMLYSNTLIVNEMFDEIMDLTFVVDLNGKIVRVNKQVHALLGYELPELINTNISDILAAKEIEEIFGRKSLIHKTVKLNDIKVTTNYGGKIPLNLSISPIVNSKNHILLGILIVGQDISLIDNLKQVITIHEITAEKLRRSEELFRTVAETTPFAIIFTKRDDNTIFYVNKHAEELYQVSREDFVGTMAIQRYQNPEIRKSLISDLNESKVVRDREVTFKRFDKSIFVGTVTMVPVHFQGEEVILSCVADITEQKILLGHIVKSEEMLRKLMDAIPDLVVVTDVSGKISYTNKSLYPMLGYDTGKGEQPSNIFELVLEEDVERVRENFTRILQEDIMPIEYKYKKKDGTCIDAEVNGTVAKDETNEPFGFVFVVRDITERKKVQETLRRSKEEIELMNYELRKRNDLLHEKSIRDGLTNLYNHQHIIELLETEIHKSEINQNNLFIMMLDIDYFKTINDQFGHQTGDRVLNTVSKLIQVNIRDTDYAGRYGGEEFLIILPDIVRDDARQLADNIRLSIENFRFQQKELKITISIGLTGTRINRVKVLIDRADRLLYQAKSKGRNQIVTDWDIEKL